MSFAGVGGAALLYPLVNQMNPSADVLALAQIDVDIAAIQPGQAIKTIWRKQPIFIRNLTPAEQAAANAVDASSLRDPQTLAERTKEGHANWLITLGRLHPSRLRAAGRGRGRDSAANMAAISAPATARITTPRRASAKARRRATSKCPNMNSGPTRPSASAEVRDYELPLG